MCAATTSEERLKIYSDGLVPQSKLRFNPPLSAYQSNRQDFESLLSGLDVWNLDLEYRNELVEHESALAVRSMSDPSFAFVLKCARSWQIYPG